MDLEYTEDQAALRDAARDVLTRECPISLVRQVFEGSADSAGLWATLVDLGWPALLVPEDDGGLGLSFVEVAIVLEEMGRVLAPGPYLTTETHLIPGLLHVADETHRKELLEAAVAGSLTATLATGDAEARHENGGWTLAGSATNILSGADVSHHLVPARTEGGTALFLVPVDEAVVTTVHAVDSTRSLAHARYEDAALGDDSLLTGPDLAPRVLDEIELAATLGLSAESLGSCEQMLAMTLQYAKEREQFERPIGSFQAIKHKLADMLVACERANALVYFAALTLAEDDERREIAVHMAKAGVGECQRLVMKESLQIHGGIGYTWEHDLHLYVRRVKTSEVLFGDSRDHLRRVADLLSL
ncbi:MAG: acyl-CoA dehydrogenase family protein [Acidimicrobiia bacterium]|nr:acyl-CoA dehydrogenase family protein [Acidimicrobiia bacterium]